MKKLVYTLMLLVGFATVSFAQESTEIARSEGAKELLNSKTDGNYVFVFDGKTAEEISKSSTYYTEYFTVAFDEPTQTVKIKMLQNDSRARAVIVRFLVASGVRYVNVDGEVISVSDFMSEYLS